MADQDPQEHSRHATGALPSSLDVLWGRRGTGARGGKPGLSVARIVGAAIEIADADGLAGVSMSKVANRLGFTTMSLYRHVANKDELLLLMWDSAFGPPPQLPNTGGWRARLEHWAREHRAGCLRHPWVLQMTVNGPPMGPGQLGWLDRGLQALEDTPLNEGDKANIVLLVSVYVLGQTRVTVDVTAAFEAGARRDGTDLEAHFALTLAELVDPEVFPALARAYAGGAFSDPDEGLDEDFTFGLERILDGVQTRITAS